MQEFCRHHGVPVSGITSTMLSTSVRGENQERAIIICDAGSSIVDDALESREVDTTPADAIYNEAGALRAVKDLTGMHGSDARQGAECGFMAHADKALAEAAALLHELTPSKTGPGSDAASSTDGADAALGGNGAESAANTGLPRRSHAGSVRSLPRGRTSSDIFPEHSEADLLEAAALAFEGRFSRGGLAALLSEAEEAVAELVPEQEHRLAHAAGSVRSISSESFEGENDMISKAPRHHEQEVPESLASLHRQGRSSLAARVAGAEARPLQPPGAALHSRALSSEALVWDADRDGGARAASTFSIAPLTGDDLRTASLVEGKSEFEHQASQSVSRPAPAISLSPQASQQTSLEAAADEEGLADGLRSSNPLDGLMRAAQQHPSPESMQEGAAERNPMPQRSTQNLIQDAKDSVQSSGAPNKLEAVLAHQRRFAPNPAELHASCSLDERTAHAHISRTTVEEGTLHGTFP